MENENEKKVTIRNCHEEYGPAKELAGGYWITVFLYYILKWGNCKKNVRGIKMVRMTNMDRMYCEKCDVKAGQYHHEYCPNGLTDRMHARWLAESMGLKIEESK